MNPGSSGVRFFWTNTLGTIFFDPAGDNRSHQRQRRPDADRAGRPAAVAFVGTPVRSRRGECGECRTPSRVQSRISAWFDRSSEAAVVIAAGRHRARGLCDAGSRGICVIDMGPLSAAAQSGVLELLRRQRDGQLHRGVHEPVRQLRRRASRALRRAVLRARAGTHRRVLALASRRHQICPAMSLRSRPPGWPSFSISRTRRSSS